MNTNRVVVLHPHAALIESFGGPSALAARLGLQAPKGGRRINNWRVRGIPELVLLKRPDVFGPAPEPAND